MERRKEGLGSGLRGVERFWLRGEERFCWFWLRGVK